MSPTPIQLTPSLCYVVSMFYMITSDGSVDPRETEHLSAILKKKKSGASASSVQHLIQTALQYVKENKLGDFLREVEHGNLLSTEQKLFILAHLLDIAFSDRDPNQAEGRILSHFKDSFKVPDEIFLPIYNTIQLKNKTELVGL